MMQIMNIFLPVVGRGSIGSFSRLGVKGKRIREMRLAIKDLEPVGAEDRPPPSN
jgi:hypothetical protein